jgi:hypothetical protein
MSDYAIEPPMLISATMGDMNEQSCSPPDPEDIWSGVLLNGPSRLRGRVDEAVRIPVCGRYSVPVTATIRPVAMLHLRISGVPHIAPQPMSLGNPRNETMPKPPLVHPGQVYLNQDVGGLFAVDIGRFITLPPHPARIEYAIEFGGHMSAPHSFEWHPVPPPQVPRGR